MKTFKSPPIHRTPLYRAKAAYCTMIGRCENANGKNPSYANVRLRMTLDEWLAWAVPQYEQFMRDHPADQPSVSRLSDVGDYVLGNIEIISFAQNRLGQRQSLQLREDGTKLCGRCRNVLIAIGNFWKDRTNPDGLRKWCISCTKEYNVGR